MLSDRHSRRINNPIDVLCSTRFAVLKLPKPTLQAGKSSGSHRMRMRLESALIETSSKQTRLDESELSVSARFWTVNSIDTPVYWIHSSRERDGSITSRVR